MGNKSLRIIGIFLVILTLFQLVYCDRSFNANAFDPSSDLPAWVQPAVPEIYFEDHINLELNSTRNRTLLFTNNFFLYFNNVNYSKIYISLNTSQINYGFTHFIAFFINSSETIYLNISFLNSLPNSIEHPLRTLDVYLELETNSSEFTIELGLLINRNEIEAQTRQSLDVNSLRWIYYENSQWNEVTTAYDSTDQFIFAETNHASFWAISYDPIYVSPIIVSLLICLGFWPVFGLIIIVRKLKEKKNQ